MKKIALLSAFLMISFFAWTQKSTVSYFYHTAQAKALYLNCGNELYVSAKDCSNPQNLKYEAENAELIQDPSTNIITVVPKKAKVSIRVFDGDKLISTEHFLVRLLPKPEIAVFSGTKELPAQESVVERNILTELTIKVFAEQGMRDALPKDMRYRVHNLNVYLYRGEEKIHETNVQGEQALLHDFLEDAQKGDKLIIEVKRVQRLNFKGEIEEVRFGEKKFHFIIG